MYSAGKTNPNLIIFSLSYYTGKILYRNYNKNIRVPGEVFEFFLQ